MISFKQFLIESDNRVWWHGSASGNLRGGISGLHLGTKEAASQALHARIGFPTEGGWDGTKEYGKTKLAGQKTMKACNLSVTGYNVHAPEHDYYPHERTEKHHYPNGDEMPSSVKPAIKAYKLTGPMSNSYHTPHEDFKANGYMRANLKKGNAKRGFYYKNVGEDADSISIVVPNGNHVKERL